MTEEQIRGWTRAGAAAGLLWRAFTAISPNLPPAFQAGETFPATSGWWYLIILSGVACSAGLLWRSRLAAFLLVTEVGSAPFLAFLWSGSWLMALPALPVFFVMVRAFEATIEHHRSARAESPPVPQRRRVLKWTAALVSVAGVAFFVWSTSGAPVQVISGRQLPATCARAIDELKLLESGERVVYFSSDALRDVRTAMYLLTDRRLVLHNQSWMESTQRVEFERISDIAFIPSMNWANNSYVIIQLDNAEELTFPLSPIAGGDERFHQALVAVWREKRPATNDGRG